MRVIVKNSIFILLTMTFLTPAYAEYKLGDGLLYNDIYVSGYSKVAYEAANGEAHELVLDDLSLFASASVNRYINPFIEVEVAGAQLWEESKDFGFRYSRIDLERLYNDITLSEALTLRLGKSLTPMGEWNRIHAAPLVWTTSRPITTQYSFSQSISGVSLKYTQADNTEYHFYYQPFEELVRKERSTNRPFYFENIYGISVDKYFGLNKKLGVAAQQADILGSGESQWVFSVDGVWKSQQFDIEFQATFADIDYKSDTPNKNKEWGGYTQVVWHFNEQWHAVVRPEYFSSRYDDAQSSVLCGLVFQPVPALSLKIEYVDAEEKQTFGLSQGWSASMAVLF